MHQAHKVTVYGFVDLTHGVEGAVVAPFKATRTAIDTRFIGRVLEGTAQQVDADELDEHGRWQRLPTGWGELQ
jgi:flagellar biosynthesis/type III secretory pathway ATPase